MSRSTDPSQSVEIKPNGTVCPYIKPETLFNLSNFESSSEIQGIEIVPNYSAYDWSKTQEGSILGGYFIGYIITQVPGAWLGRSFGSVKVLSIAMGLASIATILTPAIVLSVESPSAAYKILFSSRILIGMLQGCCYPIFHGLWGHWAPAQEISRLVAVQFAGSGIGTCIVQPIAGLLAELYGWPSIFYFTGTMGILWSIFWFYFCFDSPSVHPTITDNEKDYISQSTGENDDKSQTPPIPWLSLATSLPLWAILIAHFASNFGSYLLTSYMPMYLYDELQFDIKNASAISAIPSFVKPIITINAGFIADLLINKFKCSRITVRKVMTTIGLLPSGIAMALAGHIGCQKAAIITLFTIAVSFDGFTTPGFKSNHIEIAPLYSGILFGVTNTFGNTPGFLGPLLAGWILERRSGMDGWLIIFWIGGIIYVVGNIAFILFGKSEIQHWAKYRAVKESEEME